MEDSKTVLITGVAGFIGFHLSILLLESGMKVIGVDNINDYYSIDLKNDRLKQLGINVTKNEKNNRFQSSIHNYFVFYKIDLQQKDQIFSIFNSHRPSVVVNLAAQAGVRYSIINPEAYINSNIIGFLNIIEACRHFPVDHLVYASSSSVYGLNSTIPFSVNDAVDHPISLYATSKKSNELMAHTYSYLFGIPTTGLRFFTVYGPWGRPDMALFLFTDAIINNKPLYMFNNGDMIRDFTYVKDIVKSISLLLKKPPKRNSDLSNLESPGRSIAPYQVFNIGNSNPVILKDFIAEIEKQLDKKANIFYRPMQQGDVKMTHADVTDLVEYIGFSPKTSIEDGINAFITWYLSYYNY
jgi:UDP-glucuronate 4-epimerase